LKITLEKLMEMKNSAANGTVNKENLVDIRDVEVSQDLSVTDRILEYISLTKNPYIQKYGDTVVRISFVETDVSFEDRMKGYFEML